MRRTTLLIAALAITATIATAGPALAMRDPGPNAMYGPVPGVGQARPGGQYSDGMNLYQYVRSNPVRRADPSGLTTSERAMWQNMAGEVKGWVDAGSPDKEYHEQTATMLQDLSKYNEWQEHDWKTSGQTKQQQYNYDKEQELRAKLRSRLAIDAATGFVVIRSDTRIDGITGDCLNFMGWLHVDVYHDGEQVRLGMAGGIERSLECPITDKILWLDVDVVSLQRLAGKYRLEAGKAEGTCCKDATDQEIVDCLRHYPTAGHTNCQDDVSNATTGCCLEGYLGAGVYVGHSTSEYRMKQDLVRERTWWIDHSW